MRGGLSGYGGGVLGAHQGFGYLGGSPNQQFSLQVVVTATDASIEVGDQADWEVIVNAGITPGSGTHTSLSMTVTVQLPVGSSCFAPSDLFLGGWTNATGWIGDAGIGTSTNFSATFTRASQAAPSGTLITTTQNTSGAVPGVITITCTTLTSAQKPTGFTGAPAAAFISLNAASTLELSVFSEDPSVGAGDPVTVTATCEVTGDQTDLELTVLIQWGGQAFETDRPDPTTIDLDGWTQVGGWSKSHSAFGATAEGTFSRATHSSGASTLLFGINAAASGSTISFDGSLSSAEADPAADDTGDGNVTVS